MAHGNVCRHARRGATRNGARRRLAAQVRRAPKCAAQFARELVDAARAVPVTAVGDGVTWCDISPVVANVCEPDGTTAEQRLLRICRQRPQCCAAWARAVLGRLSLSPFTGTMLRIAATQQIHQCAVELAAHAIAHDEGGGCELFAQPVVRGQDKRRRRWRWRRGRR